MKTKGLHSKYRYIGGFGLLLLFNIALVIGITLQLFDDLTLINSNSSILEVFKSDSFLFFTGILVLVNLFFIIECRRIHINKKSITYINPIVPIIRKKRNWIKYDYYIIVDEHSQYSSNEAVWLIKDGIIKNRFSSFYYRNYEELKNEIKLEYRGHKSLGPFTQLFCIMRLKKINFNLCQ